MPENATDPTAETPPDTENPHSGDDAQNGDWAADVVPAERATPEWNNAFRKQLARGPGDPGAAMAAADRLFRVDWPRHASGLTDLSRRQAPWLGAFDAARAAGLQGPKAADHADAWYLNALGPYNLPRHLRPQQATIPGAGLEAFEIATGLELAAAAAPPAGARRRGRPPGSKTKPRARKDTPVLDAQGDPALCHACSNASTNPIHADHGKHGHAFRLGPAQPAPEIAAASKLEPDLDLDDTEQAARDAERAVGAVVEAIESVRPALRALVWRAALVRLDADEAYQAIREAAKPEPSTPKAKTP